MPGGDRVREGCPLAAAPRHPGAGVGTDPELAKQRCLVRVASGSQASRPLSFGRPGRFLFETPLFFSEATGRARRRLLHCRLRAVWALQEHPGVTGLSSCRSLGGCRTAGRRCLSALPSGPRPRAPCGPRDSYLGRRQAETSRKLPGRKPGQLLSRPECSPVVHS